MSDYRKKLTIGAICATGYSSSKNVNVTTIDIKVPITCGAPDSCIIIASAAVRPIG